MRLLGALLVMASGSVWADGTITAHYTAAGQTTETTVYSKGVRQRFETRNGGTLILQPDQQRMLQIDQKEKTYRTVALTSSAQSTPKRGGTVTYSTTIADTGETKELFGHKAKHLKTTIVREASADACDPKGQKIETDGWYIDLSTPQVPETNGAACTDQVTYQQNGAPASSMSNVGYPVEYIMTTTEAGSKPVTVSMKVTALDTSNLSAALFEAPAGFTEAQAGAPARNAVSAAAQPKPAGATRVGVVLPKDKTLTLQTPINLQDQLLSSLTQAQIEAVPIAAADANEARTRGKELQCDYVLVSEVTEIKKPTAGKIGGLLKKIPVNSQAQEAAEARVSYQLLSVEGGEPKASAEAVGKTGGFTWRNAMQVTTTVGMFAMSHYYMMMSPQMMGMFLHMQGGGVAGGSPVQMLDPMMGSILALTSRGQHPKADTSNEAAATGAAMQQVSKSVLSALGRG